MTCNSHTRPRIIPSHVRYNKRNAKRDQCSCVHCACSTVAGGTISSRRGCGGSGWSNHLYDTHAHQSPLVPSSRIRKMARLFVINNHTATDPQQKHMAKSRAVCDTNPLQIRTRTPPQRVGACYGSADEPSSRARADAHAVVMSHSATHHQ